MALSRKAKKEIESCLSAYPLKKALIVEKHREHGLPKAVTLDGVNIQSGPGNPTYNAVRKLEDDDVYQDAVKVVRVVEDTLPCLREIEREIFEIEFNSNKNKTQAGYAMEINVSERTYRNHRNKALWRFAARAGLVKVAEKLPK